MSDIDTITPADREAAEAQIAKHHKIIDYDTREYPVEVIVEKYLNRLEDDENDFFVPDYQRDLTWSEEHQSRFIESVLMGLPIPLLFFADVAGKEGRAEIVDGSQRVRTLARFMQNKLKLSGLKVLTKLDGFTYADLPQVRQRRFGRHTVRMIELREGVDEEVRRDIFSRINTGSLKLNDMEVRWGVSDGRFLQFVRRCSQNSTFVELAPMSAKAVKLREPQEFVLRFFAYLRDYQKFERSVVGFLNNYLEEMALLFEGPAIAAAEAANAKAAVAPTAKASPEVKAAEKRAKAAVKQVTGLEAELQAEWDRMLSFVRTYFPNGFTKKKGHVKTPRIRFEAISVGVALALREQPELVPTSLDWLESEEFKKHMRSDSSNSRPKVVARIEFVRDNILRAAK